MVIGFVVENGEGAVDLLGEDRPHDLVRKGHARKGQTGVGAFVDLLRESVRSADDQHQTFHAAVHAFLEPIGEFDRPHFVAPLVEQYDVVAVRQLAQDRFAFGRALLFDAEVLGVADVGQGGDREFAVEVYAPGVHFDQRRDLLRVGFAYDYQFDDHFFS